MSATMLAPQRPKALQPLSGPEAEKAGLTDGNRNKYNKLVEQLGSGLYQQNHSQMGQTGWITGMNEPSRVAFTLAAVFSGTSIRALQGTGSLLGMLDGSGGQSQSSGKTPEEQAAAAAWQYRPTAGYFRPAAGYFRPAKSDQPNLSWLDYVKQRMNNPDRQTPDPQSRIFPADLSIKRVEQPERFAGVKELLDQVKFNPDSKRAMDSKPWKVNGNNSDQLLTTPEAQTRAKEKEDRLQEMSYERMRGRSR